MAGSLLEVESAEKIEEREKYMAEKCPPLELPYSKDELVVSHDTSPDSDPDTDVRMKLSKSVAVVEPCQEQ